MKLNWRTIYTSRPLRRILVLLAVLTGLRLLTRDDRPRRVETVRTEAVAAVDWTAVNQEVRGVFVQAGGKAEQHARQAVREWTAELRKRAETDFIPWYFGYFNQQAMALRAAGYFIMDTTAAECLTGPQEDARSKMEHYIADAFMSRVLQPGNAQLRIEAITREAVKVYLDALNEGLKAVQVSYQIRDPEWERLLNGLPALIYSVEGNRQVPLLLKGVTLGSGAAVLKIGQMVSNEIRSMLANRAGREMMEHGMMYSGRLAARGIGGGVLFLGFGAWDLFDHYRTTAQNTPVMRRMLGDYFDQLENMMLNDSQCGILVTLEHVRRTVVREARVAQ
jgi:hypothetical protein